MYFSKHEVVSHAPTTFIKFMHIVSNKHCSKLSKNRLVVLIIKNLVGSGLRLTKTSLISTFLTLWNWDTYKAFIQFDVDWIPVMPGGSQF